MSSETTDRRVLVIWSNRNNSRKEKNDARKFILNDNKC